MATQSTIIFNKSQQPTSVSLHIAKKLTFQYFADISTSEEIDIVTVLVTDADDNQIRLDFSPLNVASAGAMASAVGDAVNALQSGADVIVYEVGSGTGLLAGVDITTQP